MKLVPPMQRTPMIKRVPIVDQLATAGLHPSDIAAILSTHGHWDHISGVADFPNVPVLETARGRA